MTKTSVDPTSDDDDMKLALHMHGHVLINGSIRIQRSGSTCSTSQMNHISGDDDLELALVMSLSLETAEEEDKKRDEEKDMEDLEYALRLSLESN